MPSSCRCTFGCVTTGVPIHKFPHPIKYPDLFRTWVNIASDLLKDKTDELIYKNRYICDKHFTQNAKNRNNRLNKLAVPTLHLPKSGANLHKFPNPDKDKELFNTWLYSIGGDILQLENTHIFKYRRVCQIHFEQKYWCRNNRLSNEAIPTKHMPGKENAILHLFPDPRKDLDRFNKWIYAVGGNLHILDPLYIYKCGRVCHSHFKQTFYTASRRLSPNAIPSLGLSGVGMHIMPNPEKYPERFQAWVSLLGGKLETSLDYDTYKKKRICDIHFSQEYRNRYRRLNALAVPTLHLPSQKKIDDNTHNTSLADHEPSPVPNVQDVEPKKSQATVEDTTSESKVVNIKDGLTGTSYSMNVGKLYKINCVDGKVVLEGYNPEIASNVVVNEESVENVEYLDDDTAIEDNLDSDTAVNEGISMTKGIQESNMKLADDHDPKSVIDLYEVNTTALAAMDEHKIYITKKDLAFSEDMVMIPLTKYIDMRNKLKELQMKIKFLKKLRLELRYLRRFKEKISQTFTKAQISTLLRSKKHCGWSDKELEKAAFLRKNTSHTIYTYLKYRMGFPLPHSALLRQWMINQKLIVSKRKGAMTKLNDSVKSTIGYVQNEQIQEAAQVYNPVQPPLDETAPDIVTTRVMQKVQIQNSKLERAGHNYSLVKSIHDNSADQIFTDMENFILEEEVAPPEVVVSQSQTGTWRCQLCLRSARGERELRAHVAAHYRDTELHYTTYLDAQSPFECEFCGARVRGRPGLARHHRAHLGLSAFYCDQPGCNYVTNGTKKLRRHSARAHSARVRRLCSLCGAVTHRRHLRAHTRPPRLKCGSEGCPMSFYSARERSRHRAAHSERLYACERCPHTPYKRKAAFDRHMRNHEVEKSYKCRKCPQVFHDYGEFHEHNKRHRVRQPPYKCACTTSFRFKKHFERHQLQCKFAVRDSSAANTDVLQEDNLQVVPEQTKKRYYEHYDADKYKKRRKIIQETAAIEENVASGTIDQPEECKMIIIQSVQPDNVITMTMEEYKQNLLLQQNSEQE